MKSRNKRNKPYDKDVQITKVAPSHTRDRLKRKIAQKAYNDDEVQITKIVPPQDELQITKVAPAHPRYRLQRALRNAPKTSINKNALEDLPDFNTNIKVDETDKIRRKEAIFDKIINQLPPDNDKYYIKHNKKNDTCTVKKDVKRRPVLKQKYAQQPQLKT